MTEYIAPQVQVDCMGVKFDSYMLENGEVVYSERSAATGLGIPISTFQEYRAKLPEKIKGRSVTGNEGYEALKSLLGKGLSVTGRVKVSFVNNSGRAGTTYMNPISKSELVAWVILLGDIGNTRCQAMKDAGFATVFQMAEDRAYGVQRTQEEYQTRSTELRQFIEEQREKLRMTTQKITKPILGPNVFGPNNSFIYCGKTRDTYNDEDAGFRHHLNNAAEMIEVGAKLAGLSVKESVHLAHNYLKRVVPELEE